MERKKIKNEITESKIKIADLATLSGVSNSTIHHYVRSGVLHPPKESRVGRSVYDLTHLRTLKRIRELRENDRLSLTKIKEIVSKENLYSDRFLHEDDTALLVQQLEEKKRGVKAQKDEMKRLQIVDAAIALFSLNGYEKTTLDAIADSLNMAKSTVYLYFENKDHLFMECIGRLTYIAVPENEWEDIRKEKDYLNRIKKRAIAFHKAFPTYKGILTMTKAALGSENDKMAEKAKETLSIMTRPIKKDIRRGITGGVFRDIDEEIISYLFLGMGEALGFRFLMDSQYTIEKGIEIMFDMIGNGIIERQAQKQDPHLDLWEAEVKDTKGFKNILHKIRFGGMPFLTVKMGSAEVKIQFEKIKSAQFRRKSSKYNVEIVLYDDETIYTEVDGNMILSGEVSFGEFSIELKNLENIIFRLPKINTDVKGAKVRIP